MYEPRQYIESWPIVMAKKLQVARIMRLANRRGAIIISYHGVIADRDWHDWETADMIAVSVFRKHLAFLRKHYHVIPLRKILTSLHVDGQLRDTSVSLPPNLQMMPF